MKTTFFKLKYISSLFIILVGVNSFAQKQNVSDTILSIREYNKAVLFYQNDKYDSALIHINKGIKLNPSYAYCYALKAEIFCLKNQYKESLMLSYEALKLKPNMLNWQGIKGRCETYLKFYDEAIKSFTKYLTINQTNDGAYADRAFCYFNLKQYPQALEDIQKSISINNYINYYVLKAEINYYLDNIDSALIDLNYLVKRGNQDIKVFNLLGRCYAQKKDSTNARKYFTESLNIESKNSLTYLYYATAEYYMDNCALAKTYCKKSLEYVDSKKTNAIDRYNLRGLINVCLGDTQAALSDFATAININPKEMAPHYNRMKLIFDDTTQVVSIIKECDDMIHSNIDSSELCYIYNLRAFVKLRSNNKQGALQDLEIAKNYSKTKSFIYYNIAAVYIYFMDSSGNQLDEAIIDNLKKSLLIDNKNIDAYKLLAVSYYFKKDLNMACEIVKKALKITSDSDLLYMKDYFCSKKKPKNQQEILIEPFKFTDGNSTWMKDFVDSYKKTKKNTLPLHLL